ncbi:hypothetical protein O3P69_002518 [Scylla paramamosain]|uniref:Homeobox domain-containing protein n=1 Tax=Scylla paramamosain TaxID=85552 RepID=A0AAW0UKV5_SCYPA
MCRDGTEVKETQGYAVKLNLHTTDTGVPCAREDSTVHVTHAQYDYKALHTGTLEEAERGTWRVALARSHSPQPLAAFRSQPVPPTATPLSQSPATNGSFTGQSECGDATTTNPSSSSPTGKTRTKDKYRVVYSDHQRLELEKEFHYSRYITIRRKSELASMLGLSERQVKIWFQNRRAKERKQMKKRDELHNKEKLDVGGVGGVGGMGGVQQYHPPSVTPIPPMHAHVPSHHHHHHHHHQTGKPIIMDIKPPLGMD